MADNLNFTNNLTLTKVSDADVFNVFFDITTDDGLIISKASLMGQTTTISGDLTVTGNLNVTGDTVVNNDTKLAITDKNVLMNVPSEPVQPSGTSTLSGSIVATAIVTNPAVGFLPAELVVVTFEPPPSGVTATGTVTADGTGNVAVSAPVTIINPGSGYIVAPAFTFGGAVIGANIPPRPTITEDNAGTIVIRDWWDETQAPVGILWNEAKFAWDLNRGIMQDIYLPSPSGPVNALDGNPRVINIGSPVDPDDAVNYQTLTDWTLSDITDVTIAGPSVGQALIYDNSGDWVNGSINFSDISGITIPTATSGYLFWDHLALPPTFDFVTQIPALHISGLSAVATSGNGKIRNLTDVAMTKVDDNLLVDNVVLAWDSATQRWKDTPLTSLGTFNRIQDDPTTPTAYVEAESGFININATTADINITNTTQDINIEATLGDIKMTAVGVAIDSDGPIVLSDGSGNGGLYATSDLTLATDTGDLYLQDVIFPKVAGASDNSILVLNTLTNALEWEVPSYSSSQSEITNPIANAYVSTIQSFDRIDIVAPSIGAPSDDNIGVVSDPIGVYINPGHARQVVVGGLGDSTIHSDRSLDVSANGQLSLVSGDKILISDYEFPSHMTSRSPGDVMILNPDDITGTQLIFKTFKELPTDAIGALRNNGNGTLTWGTVIEPLNSTMTLIVGPSSGRHFTTINEALAYVTEKYYPMHVYGLTVRKISIVLQASYIMAEQVFADGMDLSWVEIYGTNHLVTVDATTFTRTVLFDGDEYTPAFASINSGKLPTLAVKFALTTSNTGIIGALSSGANSAISITSDGGFNNFYINILAQKSSTIHADGANFSKVGAANEVEYGVIADSSSTISIVGSTVTGCNYGVAAKSNSTIDCSNSIATASLQFGVWAAHGSHINAVGTSARVGMSDDEHDIVVQNGATISANSAIGGTGQWDGNFCTPLVPLSVSSNGIIFA